MSTSMSNPTVEPDLSFKVTYHFGTGIKISTRETGGRTVKAISYYANGIEVTREEYLAVIQTILVEKGMQ